MMQVNNLFFSYKNQKQNILEAISMSIPAHQITSVIGPNGSGKSTLFRCLTGQYTPLEGSITLEGKPLGSYSGKERAKKLAMVYQQHPNIVGVTVRELIEAGRTPYQSWMSRGQTDSEFIDDVLKWTDLKELESKRVEALSGGQRQRVWLAQALAQQPDVLLLDEPNNFLDMQYQVELLEFLKELNKEKGITIAMIMHDLTQVLDISDKVIALKDGTLHSQGAPEEVLTESIIEELYGVKTELVETKSGDKLIHYLGLTKEKMR